jgi:hypothetical protein
VLRKSIDFHFSTLAVAHLLQLCFLEIGDYPWLVFHNRHQRLPDLHALPGLDRLSADSPAHWGLDDDVGKLQPCVF